MYYLMFFAMSICLAAPWIFFPRRVKVGINIEKRPNLFWTFLSFLPCIIFMGYRGDIADSTAYRLSYINDERTPFEAISNGYSFFVSLAKSIGINADDFLFLVCLVSCLLLIRMIYKHSDSLVISIYYFFGSLIFFWLINGIRQFIAVCIVFNSIPALANRKALRFTLLTLLAFWFHSSAIIMFPIFFVVNNKSWSIEMIVKCIGFTLLMLIVFLIPSLMELLFSTIGFDAYIESISTSVGGSIARVFIALIPSLIAYPMRHKINEENNKLMNTCLNLSFLSAGLYLVAAFTSGIYVGRIPLYFSISDIILLPYLIKRIDKKDWKTVILIFVFIFYLLFFIYEFVYPESMNYHSSVLNIFMYD